jgi:serine protease
MKTSATIFALLAGFLFPAATEAAIIHVPADAATIQRAIDAAAAGDTVLVAPGTYVETITFRGKAITVVSEQGPAVTIIDGNRAGSVVSFAAGENRNAVLQGFTVRNGANSFSGGGILIQNSAPSIIGNWIVGNGACSGAGIYSYFSSPLIKGNTISRNYVYACSGASGLGVYIGGDSAAELIENVITENSGFANGGGVTLFAAGRAVLRSNVIARNVTSGFSPCTSGGGIWMVNFSQATIVNNLVVGNAAGCGGGFYWGASSGVTTFVNNTFADNDGAEGSAIAVSGVDTRHVIDNNLIIGKGGQTAFYCRNSSSTPSPLLNTSNVFSPQGLAYGGTCLDQTGLRGNISADPLFVRNAFGDVLGDYRLQMASPAIDAGALAPNIPEADLDGNPRIADGNQDGEAGVDLGAYEYQYTNQPPVADAGADQTVTADGSCRATVALDGGASSDAHGDPLTFTWTGPFGTVAGATASVSLPAGTHVITLTVGDGRGGSSSDTLTVTVVDTTAPAIQSAAAAPSVLAPAKRQLVAVTISVSASDACGGSVRCQITSVTSNEPIDGDDWVVTGDLTLKLRATRSNKGNGRIYTITIVCTDAAGNTSSKTVIVTVPR